MHETIPYASASRRAQDLLASRLHEPWSVFRLAWTLGLSNRTLHRVVRRELGLSPMQLLRRARLAEARSRLETARPGGTVTRVALDCGFVHLGRFSQEYARQFGESPSETLRRARRRAAALGGRMPGLASTAA
jgi:transcriptional regulator GlxA family with amidase domain